MFTRSVSPEQAPDKATYIEIDFEKGDPVAINGKKLSPATLLTDLNKVRLLCCGTLRPFSAEMGLCRHSSYFLITFWRALKSP